MSPMVLMILLYAQVIKVQRLKNIFLNYKLLNCDIDFDISSGTFNIIKGNIENWNIKVIDTGEETMTGGRLKRINEYIKNDDYFLMTYGDGLANVNISDLIKFHKSHGKLATVTAVQPEGRFGMLDINNEEDVINFHEKPAGDGGVY